jgi:hypothetical protein
VHSLSSPATSSNAGGCENSGIRVYARWARPGSSSDGFNPWLMLAARRATGDVPSHEATRALGDLVRRPSVRFVPAERVPSQALACCLCVRFDSPIRLLNLRGRGCMMTRER